MSRASGVPLSDGPATVGEGWYDDPVQIVETRASRFSSEADRDRLRGEEIAFFRRADHAFEAELAQSDTLYREIEQARTAGRDAEADFVELCVRLRRYVASRAKSSDKARVTEGKTLLAPLLDEVARLRAIAATRATLRENEKKAAAPAAPAAL